jgi:hypothetical protein
MLIATFNAALVGLFLAGIAASLTISPGFALAAGLVGGAIYLVIVLRLMQLRLAKVWAGYEPRFSSPPPQGPT